MIKKTSFLFLFALFCSFGVAQATEISMNTAIMQAMDKITGQVDLIEVPVNREVLFGSFSILVHNCKTRAPEETPDNFAFVDIVDNISPEVKVNIFKGWMVSSSPALNPVAHPVYDVWLLKCVNGADSKIPPMTEEALETREKIAMSRNPDLEYSSLTKKDESSPVEEKISNGEPENLIPADLPEQYEQDVNKDENALEQPVEDKVITNDVISKEVGAPEALIVIEEENQASPLLEDKPQNLLEADENAENVSEVKPEQDILQLEKELSEKALNN